MLVSDITFSITLFFIRIKEKVFDKKIKMIIMIIIHDNDDNKYMIIRTNIVLHID